MAGAPTVKVDPESETLQPAGEFEFAIWDPDGLRTSQDPVDGASEPVEGKLEFPTLRNLWVGTLSSWGKADCEHRYEQYKETDKLAGSQCRKTHAQKTLHRFSNLRLYRRFFGDLFPTEININENS